jgi:hypothetical protein
VKTSEQFFGLSKFLLKVKNSDIWVVTESRGILLIPKANVSKNEFSSRDLTQKKLSLNRKNVSEQKIKLEVIIFLTFAGNEIAWEAKNGSENEIAIIFSDHFVSFPHYQVIGISSSKLGIFSKSRY